MATLFLQAITGAHTLTCLLSRIRSRRNRDAPIERYIFRCSKMQRGCEPGNWLMLHFLFYAESELAGPTGCVAVSSLLFQVDGLVVVAGDASANVGYAFACFCLAVGVEGLFGAGGALGAVQALIAAAQA